MKTIILSVAFLVGLLSKINAETKESVQTIDHPHKNEYTSVLAGSDKHKYGYELKENRHFHHTTTEEDGVRLGCYGYVLEGKKYSTQYVADVQGYRPVLTHDSITVYPKSGGERKASFVGGFKEDQQRSENIRYFFPDGCKGSDVNVMPLQLGSIPNPSIQVNKFSNPAISPPKQTPKKPEFLVPGLNVLPPFGSGEILKFNSVPVTVKPVTKPVTNPPTLKPVTANPVTQKLNPTPPPVTRPPVTIQEKITKPTKPFLNKIPTPATKDGSCQKSTCCAEDESTPKLVLPIPMKTLGKTSGSCETFAKLIIPVGGLNPDSLKSLTRGADTADLIKTILQSLS